MHLLFIMSPPGHRMLPLVLNMLTPTNPNPQFGERLYGGGLHKRWDVGHQLGTCIITSGARIKSKKEILSSGEKDLHSRML